MQFSVYEKEVDIMDATTTNITEIGQQPWHDVPIVEN